MFKRIKKAFTLVELIVTLTVISILAGVAVGITYGVMDNHSTDEINLRNEKTQDMWISYATSFSVYDTLEEKAEDFCINYTKNQGLIEDINYRVLEFDNLSKVIQLASSAKEEKEEPSIQYARNDNNEYNKAVLFKIGENGDSFFVATSSTILENGKVTKLQEADINSRLSSSLFVTESKTYRKYIKPNDMFELAKIHDNQSGKDVWAHRYIKYNIVDGAGTKLREPIYAKNNRPISDYVDMDKSDFGLGDVYHDNKIGAVGAITKFKDEQGNDFDTTMPYISDSCETIEDNESSLNKNKYQYLVDEVTLVGKAYFKHFDDNGNEIFEDIQNADDITNHPEWFPIALMFDQESKMFWKRIFNIPTIKTIYFNNMFDLSMFLESDAYDKSKVKPNTTFLFISDNVVLNTTLYIPEDINIVLDWHPFDKNLMNETRKAIMKTDRKWDFVDGDYNANIPTMKQDESDLTNILNPNYSKKENSNYFLMNAYAEEPTRTFRIGENGHLILSDKTLLDIEGKIHMGGWCNGVLNEKQSELINDGLITLNSGSCIRAVTGRISGSGTIIVNNGANVYESLKGTDYIESRETWIWNSGCIDQYLNDIKTFFFENYFIDNIRCEMRLQYGSTYNLYTAVSRSTSSVDGVTYSVFTTFKFISNDTRSLFVMMPDSEVVKSCYKENNEFLNEIYKTKIQISRGIVMNGALQFEYNKTAAVKYQILKIDTHKMYFPISNMKIEILDGACLGLGYFGKNLKNYDTYLSLYPSSQLVINAGGSLKLEGTTQLSILNFTNNQLDQRKSSILGYTHKRNGKLVLSISEKIKLFKSYMGLYNMFENYGSIIFEEGCNGSLCVANKNYLVINNGVNSNINSKATRMFKHFTNKVATILGFSQDYTSGDWKAKDYFQLTSI